MFLQVFLVYLSRLAMSNGQDPPSIHYLENFLDGARILSFLPDGSVIDVTSIRGHRPQYVLSDSVYKAYGTVLNIEVASDKDSNYNQF